MTMCSDDRGRAISDVGGVKYRCRLTLAWTICLWPTFANCRPDLVRFAEKDCVLLEEATYAVDCAKTLDTTSQSMDSILAQGVNFPPLKKEAIGVADVSLRPRYTFG